MGQLLPGLDFIGIENYIRLFTDDLRFWEAFGRLSMLSLTTVFLQYVIGFSLALMVWKDIVFQRFFRVLFLIPMMTTPVIMTVIWRTFFHESLGPVNDFFKLCWNDSTLAQQRAARQVYGILVEVWQWTPFMFLLLLGGSFITAQRTVFGRLYRRCWAHPDLCLRDLSIDGAHFDWGNHHPAD